MVRNADAIVLNTDALLGSFRERYPQFADKMSSIPNGYDGTLASSPCLTVNRGRPIRILHAGALYSQRSPAAALQENLLQRRFPPYDKYLNVCWAIYWTLVQRTERPDVANGG